MRSRVLKSECHSEGRITRTTPWTVQTVREICENRVSTEHLQIKFFLKPHSRLEALLRKWGPLSQPISGFRPPPGDFKFCLKAQTAPSDCDARCEKA